MKKFLFILLISISICISHVYAQDDWNDNSTTVVTSDNWNANATTEDDWNANTSDNWNDNNTSDSWNDNTSDNWNDNNTSDSWNDNKKNVSNEEMSPTFWGILIAVFVAMAGGALFIGLKSNKGKKNENEDDEEDDDNDFESQNLHSNLTHNTAAASQSRMKNSDQFMVNVGGRQHGPYTLQQMQGFIQQGRMNKNTLVMIVGKTSWIPAGQDHRLNSMLTKAGY